MIRLAISTDFPAITELTAASYGHYVERLGRKPQPMSDDYRAAVEGREVRVLERDGQIVGLLVTDDEPNCLLVRTVAVAPHLQRQGLGTELMAAAEIVAWEKSVSRLRLYTNEVMDGTVQLYGQLGYHEVKRDGPDGAQVIYLEKEAPIDRANWYDVVVTDSQICFGKPRLAGTRLYLDILLSYLEAGKSFDDIVDDYPQVTHEQLAAMMGFVRDCVAAKRNQLKSERHG